MKAGKTKRFRVFAGGNRTGKSLTVGYEGNCHWLLEYPDWWEGYRFDNISTVWIIAESSALFRDSLQATLFGKPGEEIGTGIIPLAEKNGGVGLVEWKSMQGIPGGIGSAIVKNKKGRAVSIIIKTNEMTREQFQAANVDLIIFDEEPRPDIYTECLTRLIGTGRKKPGIAMFAFTPLRGLSEVVLKFLPNGQFPERGSPIDEPHKYVCRVEWEDVPHLSKEDKDQLLSEYPTSERDARSKGIPALGSGRIYPVDEDFLIVKPFRIPEYWRRAYGLDFASPNGWTAAIWMTQDPQTKIKYIFAEYKKTGVIDEYHVQAIRNLGAWIPGACDPHSGRHDDHMTRLDFYRSRGLDLVDGDNAIVAGISRLLSQFETGGIKIFSTCQELLKEYRIYRYDAKDPNKPAKNQQDHLLDALRYLDSRFDWIAKCEEDVLGRRNIRRPKRNNSVTGY